MRSDWLLPICTGGERLKDDGDKVHPTQKPEALLHRVILASTKPGDVVLDPFFGTGTTGAVAKRLGRRFIGIEREQEYAAMAQQRIDQVESLLDEDVDHDAIQARGAAHALRHAGRARPADAGPVLSDDAPPLPAPGARRRQPRLRGRSASRGSIHKIGAAVQGAPACNGWTFWHVDAEGAAAADRRAAPADPRAHELGHQFTWCRKSHHWHVAQQAEHAVRVDPSRIIDIDRIAAQQPFLRLASR